MATAADIVNAYLEKQRGRTASTKHTEITEQATKEIVGELPDGFTITDVRQCVKEMLNGNPEAEGLTANARGRVVTKTLNDSVNEGALSLDEEGRYRHADPTHQPAQPVAAAPR